MKGWPLTAVALLVASVILSADSLAASPVDEDVVAKIDARVRESWQDAGVVASRPAPDGPWARRLYLDLLGRTPTVEDLEAFLDQPQRSRREWLVDRLLGDDYREERSRWQSIEWSNLLVGRTGGRVGGSLVHRDGFEAYLRDAFAESKPYDQLMRELVTATGSVRPEDEDFDGAANFLADKMADNGVQATAKTAQVFLGVSVQCTQCHDHPFNEGRQNQFWELNAFFRQTRAERIRDMGGGRPRARIVQRDFYGEGRGPRAAVNLVPGQAERAETYYELRNGKLKVAYPAFLDGTTLSDVFTERGVDYGDSGRLELVNRREELASLIAESPELARSAVNREWGRLLGYGFTRPVYDMGPHNPPVMPELLDELAAAFRNSGYDHDRLTRWIVLSRPYGLDSRAGRSNEGDEPSLGHSPLFSRFYLRQLTAEQIYESLLTATRADETVDDEEKQEQMRQRWLRQFSRAFGNDENGEATSFNGSIPQALAMMNSDLMRRATALRWKGDRKGWKQKKASRFAAAPQPEPAGFLSSVAADATLDNAEKVDRLYLAALARRPDRGELKACNQLLAARDGDAPQALRDIWWALLNSNEFILQH